MNLWRACEEGKVKEQVVWSLDKLALSPLRLALLLDELAEMDVAFVSLKEGLNSNIIRTIVQSLAVSKADLTKRRPGRRKGQFEKVDGAVRREVVSMYTEQWDIKAIARTLHLSRTTVYRILDEEGAR
jgi:DNA invertase Pin-like site-specific DNA recombinase